MALQIVQDSPDDLMNSLRQKVAEAVSQQEAFLKTFRDSDNKIRLLLKKPVRKPRDSAEVLQKKIKDAEFLRSTSSMSLNAEKGLLREMEENKKLVKTIDEYTKFQEQIETYRATKDEADKNFKEQKKVVTEMKKGLAKLELANKLKIDAVHIIDDEMQIPEEFIGLIIGKKGARKQELEQEYGVELELSKFDKGKARISGTRENCEKIKEVLQNIMNTVTEEHPLPDGVSLILTREKGALLKQIESSCEVRVKIDRENNLLIFKGAPDMIKKARSEISKMTSGEEIMSIHAKLFPSVVGAKGAVIRAIQERTGATIDINRDDANIKIRGSDEQVAAAKAEITTLTEGELSISVDTKLFPAIVGSKGATIRKVQEESGAVIDLDRAEGYVMLRGTTEQVSKADVLIRALIKENEDHTAEYPLDKEDIPTIIGPKGATIAEIQRKAQIVDGEEAAEDEDGADEDGEDEEAAEDGAEGAADEDGGEAGEGQAAAKPKPKKKKKKASGAYVKFDIEKEPTPMLRIRANLAQLPKAKQLVEELLAKLASMKREMPVNKVLIPTIIGKGGENIKKLAADTGCNISFDREGRNVIKFRGEPESLDKAEEAIKAILKENEISEMPISAVMVDVLLENKGAEISRLEKENEMKINLDKEGQSLTFRGSEERTANAKKMLAELEVANQVDEMPLAQEDVSVLVGPKGAHIKALQEETECNIRIRDEENKIVLRGTVENIAKAKKAINGKVGEAEDGTCTLLDGVEPSAMGILVGPKGKNIKALQEEFELKLDLLRTRCTVRFRGTDAEKVAACKAKVVDLLENTRITSVVPVPASCRIEGRRWEMIKSIETEMEISLDLKDSDRDGEGKVILVRGTAGELAAAKKRTEQLLTGKYFEEFLVSDEQMKTIIGSATTNIAKIEAESFGATVKCNQAERTVTIEGDEMSVPRAKQGVQQMLKFFFPSEFEQVDIPRASIGFFIKSSRAQLRKIKNEADVTVSIDASGSALNISGSAENIAKAKTLVEEAIVQWGKLNAEIQLEPGMSAAVIGKKGETINKMQKDTGAKIKVNSYGNTAKVSGTEEQVEAASKILTEMVEKYKREHRSISVPVDDVATIIGRGGATIKKITEESGAKIDVNSDTGLVTFKGDEECLTKAEELVKKILEENKTERMDVDSRDFRLVVGTKGATIRQLQEDSGASIDIDRDNSQVIFRGSEESIAKAKEAVSQIIEAEIAARAAQREQEDKEWQEQQQQARESRAARKADGANDDPVDTFVAPQPVAAPARPLSKSAAKRLRQKSKRAEGGVSALLGVPVPAARSVPGVPPTDHSATAPKAKTATQKVNPVDLLLQSMDAPAAKSSSAAATASYATNGSRSADFWQLHAAFKLRM